MKFWQFILLGIALFFLYFIYEAYQLLKSGVNSVESSASSVAQGGVSIEKAIANGIAAALAFIGLGGSSDASTQAVPTTDTSGGSDAFQQFVNSPDPNATPSFGS